MKSFDNFDEFSKNVFIGDLVKINFKSKVETLDENEMSEIAKLSGENIKFLKLNKKEPNENKVWFLKGYRSIGHKLNLFMID